MWPPHIINTTFSTLPYNVFNFSNLHATLQIKKNTCFIHIIYICTSFVCVSCYRMHISIDSATLPHVNCTTCDHMQIQNIYINTVTCYIHTLLLHLYISKLKVRHMIFSGQKYFCVLLVHCANFHGTSIADPNWRV